MMQSPTQFLVKLGRNIKQAMLPALAPSLGRRAFIVAAATAFVFAGLPAAQSAFARDLDDAHWVGT